MLNGMTVLRFENMPELARSGGKKTAQCTHCALVPFTACAHSLQLQTFTFVSNICIWFAHFQYAHSHLDVHITGPLKRAVFWPLPLTPINSVVFHGKVMVRQSRCDH